MSLEQLWAGWRSAYVESVPTRPVDGVADAEPGEGGVSDCVFCRIIQSPGSDEERGVVYTAARSIAILNAYPYASGHLLVMPLRHVSELGELEADEAAELWSTTLSAGKAIDSAYEPDGMNLGANIGRAAGAGIPKHLHLHVVPRWIGDTNFMTAVASVRVLPEALDRTWARLRENWPT